MFGFRSRPPCDGCSKASGFLIRRAFLDEEVSRLLQPVSHNPLPGGRSLTLAKSRLNAARLLPVREASSSKAMSSVKSCSMKARRSDFPASLKSDETDKSGHPWREGNHGFMHFQSQPFVSGCLAAVAERQERREQAFRHRNLRQQDCRTGNGTRPARPFASLGRAAVAFFQLLARQTKIWCRGKPRRQSGFRSRPPNSPVA